MEYVTTFTELEIENETEWLRDLQKLMADINLQAEKMEKYKHESKSKGLRLKRMKMPQFNVDITDYPRFKSHFQKQVQPTVVGEQEAAYALKCCLSNTAFQIIRNVDDDFQRDLRTFGRKIWKTIKVERRSSE